MISLAKPYTPEVQQEYLKDVKEINVKFLKLLKLVKKEERIFNLRKGEDIK